jgi:alpha-L-arabinofuranosidase
VELRTRAEQLSVPAAAGSAKMTAISGSASLKSGRVTVTLTNPSLDAPLTVRLHLPGATAAEARATVLTHADPNGRNTFDRPNEVTPAPLAATMRGSAVEVVLPKHCVAGIEIRV